MKKIIEINKCPNCSGKLEKTDKPNIVRCIFCDSEFEVEAEEEAEVEEKAEAADETVEESKPKKAVEDGFKKPEWFEYRVEFKKLLKGHDSKEAMNAFAYCTNELGTSEAIIKYIKREIIDDSGIYHKGHKAEKLNAFLNSKFMKGQITADDNIIFYVNTGIFSCGKHGFIITDKKIVFSGRKPHTIDYSDLRKLSFDMDSDFVNIRLNGSFDTTIGTIEGGSFKAHGALAALVCALSFENEPDRDKIIVCKFDDEEDDD